MKRLTTLFLAFCCLGLFPTRILAQANEAASKHTIRVEVGQSNGSAYSAGYDYVRQLKPTWRMRVGIGFSTSAQFANRYRQIDETGEPVETSLESQTNLIPFSIYLEADFLRARDVTDKTSIFYGPGVSLGMDSIERELYDHTRSKSFQGNVGFHALLGGEYAFNQHFSLQAQTGISLNVRLTHQESSSNFIEPFGLNTISGGHRVHLSTSSSRLALCYHF